MSSNQQHIDTTLARAGCEHDGVTGAITPPIHLSTTFHRDPDGSYGDRFQYSRIDAPTRKLFEEAMSRIECPSDVGEGDTAAFASGMAAISAVLQTLKPGDHLLLSDDVYMTTRSVIEKVFGHWGLQKTEVDMTDEAALKAALQAHQPHMVWVESPTNPTLKVVDIGQVARIVGEHATTSAVKPLVVVDSTFNSPYLVRPLALGADLVIHASTKYVGGHSDMQAGTVSGRRSEVMTRIREIQINVGGVAAPFDCWLALRGLRSLAARMHMHCSNAMVVARFLEAHPKVEEVFYPGLPSHKGHAVATAQAVHEGMYGGMLSFLVDGGDTDAGRDFAFEVAGKLQIIVRATSLGGTESLIEHRESIEHPPRSPKHLLRMSVGLEHPDDLVADLTQALGGKPAPAPPAAPPAAGEGEGKAR